MTATLPARSRHFEDQQIRTEDGVVLHAKLMQPKTPMCAQRVVLISPLVGAGAGQQLLLFRDFSRRGAIVISYEYRGHPGSTGTFDLDSTVVDTRSALQWALDYANDRELPLHGFAKCYGVVTLLAQFRAGGLGLSLRSLSTVSGLYHLNQILRISDFAAIVSRYVGRDLDASSLVAELVQGTIDCAELPLRQALREYLVGLMPELRVELNSFEELSYDRVNVRQMLLDFARANYLDGVNVPAWMPCTAILGVSDHLLGMHTPEGRLAYRNRVASVVPHVKIHEVDMDHFGRGPGHDQMIQWAGDAFENAEKSVVPPCHIGKVPQHRILPR
jgi:hypothetical protein